MYHSQPRSLFSHLSILITKGIPSDLSSYLDVGRRPKLKSDEKSEGIPLVVEIFLALRLKRLKKVYHLLGARPSAEARFAAQVLPRNSVYRASDVLRQRRMRWLKVPSTLLEDALPHRPPWAV